MQWHIPEDQNSQVHHCENLKHSLEVSLLQALAIDSKWQPHIFLFW
jgi:hypothetical protein